MSTELPPQSEELTEKSAMPNGTVDGNKTPKDKAPEYTEPEAKTDKDVECKVDKKAEIKLLVFAFIIGISVNAVLSSILTSEVSFSIFPLITMVLSSQMLYQIYLHNALSEDTPLVGLACFFVGIFGYAAFLKATHPAMGTNFFSIMICIVLIFWIGKKLGVFNRKS